MPNQHNFSGLKAKSGTPLNVDEKLNSTDPDKAKTLAKVNIVYVLFGTYIRDTPVLVKIQSNPRLTSLSHFLWPRGKRKRSEILNFIFSGAANFGRDFGELTTAEVDREQHLEEAHNTNQTCITFESGQHQ